MTTHVLCVTDEARPASIAREEIMMSFQAYLDAIKHKTGKTPAEFREYGAAKAWLAKGKLRPDVKAGTIIADLKQEFGLGHGHAMAIVALLKGSKKEGDR